MHIKKYSSARQLTEKMMLMPSLLNLMKWIISLWQWLKERAMPFSMILTMMRWNLRVRHVQADILPLMNTMAISRKTMTRMAYSMTDICHGDLIHDILSVLA